MRENSGEGLVSIGEQYEHVGNLSRQFLCRNKRSSNCKRDLVLVGEVLNWKYPTNLRNLQIFLV